MTVYAQVKSRITLLVLLGMGCLALLLIPTGQDDVALRVAILTPVTHPSLEEIQAGFVEALEASVDIPIRFDTFNAQGNLVLLRGEVEEVANRNYDLVFAISNSCAQVAKEVMEKRGQATPIVYAAVPRPVDLGLIRSEASSGNQLTGTIELTDYPGLLAILDKLPRPVENMVIPYDPRIFGLEESKDEIMELARERGIRVTPVPVFQTNEMKVKLEAHMDAADMVLVLKDNTVVSALDVVVKLADKYQVPLVASDLGSHGRGASLSYGVPEQAFGTEAAALAKQILVEQMDPGILASKGISCFELKVDSEAAARQGLEVPEA